MLHFICDIRRLARPATARERNDLEAECFRGPSGGTAEIAKADDYRRLAGDPGVNICSTW